MSHLSDQFGRRVTYLRLSVTDRCDLRCTYCMAEKMKFLPKRDVLTLEELITVSEAFIERGIRKIRVTGGEPLVRKDIMALFNHLGQHVGEGLDELTLTTNGTHLATFAEDLFAAGVRRINVSIDTLNTDTFRELTRGGDLEKTLEGIRAAAQAGLKIKINTVALKNTNADELVDLVAWAHHHGHDISFIEVMPLGETHRDRSEEFLPLSSVREWVEARWPIIDAVDTPQHGGPARYVRIPSTGGKVGFISPLTNNFCASCNRIRVTCTGRIYMCLGQDDHIDLRSALRQEREPLRALHEALDQALLRKPERHHFQIAKDEPAAVARHMSTTGG